MILVDNVWMILAASALALGFGLAMRVIQGGRDAFSGCDLGPGDVDAGHYLASGRIAWGLPAVRRKGNAARSHGRNRTEAYVRG